VKKIIAVAFALCVAPLAYAQDGASCATAYSLAPGTVNVDTTTATGWINNFGPLVSPANDVAYTFTTGSDLPTGTITPSAGSFLFGIYLLNSCNAGAGPTPIATSSSNGEVIDLAAVPGISPNTQYWVVVTGVPAGGPGANGTVTLEITPTLPVTLQSFEIL